MQGGYILSRLCKSRQRVSDRNVTIFRRVQIAQGGGRTGVPGTRHEFSCRCALVPGCVRPIFGFVRQGQ
jgi:hypothetical protein